MSYRILSLFGRSSACLIYAGIVLLFFVTSAQSRMDSKDLKAIYETGLIPLTEDQDGVYKSGRDYLVFETMRVKRGDTVVFAPGARIFFHSNSKITVHGVLKFDGTPEEPVTIGKLNVTIPKLTKKTVMQFDSTSFYVYRTASLIMNHVEIADSTISFRCTDSTSNFTFYNVHCSGNRMTLPDTVLDLWPGSFITCQKQEGFISPNCIPPMPLPDSLRIMYKIGQFWKGVKPGVQVGIGVGILATAAAWYYHNDKAADARRRYDSYKDSKKPFREEEQICLIAIRNRNLAAYAAGCGVAALTLTFVIGGGDK